MKIYFISACIFLLCINSFAQQVDTTRTNGEKRDSLKASGVTAQRSLMKIQAEKITYDVENDIDSRTMTVLDMLRKLPMVTVNSNDEIKVNGSTSFKVYVDGRPDQMLSAKPSSMFKVMPSSNIKSIEVIINPGAKYDAEGVGGVLALITIGGSRKVLPDSVYGSMMTGVTTLKSIYGAMGLNIRFGKWTIGTNIEPSHYENIGLKKIIDRKTSTYSAREIKMMNAFNNTYSSNLAISYEADSLNLFTSSIGLDYSPNRGQMYDGNYSANETYNDIYSYDMSAHYDERWGNIMSAFDWQHSFKANTKRILTLSWQLSGNPTRTRDTTFISNIKGNLPFEPDDVLLVKNTKSLENSFQADYSAPIGTNQSFITGVKSIFRKYQTIATDGLTPIDYKYHCNIGSAYAEYKGTFGQFTSIIGLRYEHTWQNYKETGQNFHIDYGNFVPNASLQFELNPKSNLSLSYNLRISRPGIYYMSPHIDRSDPNAIYYGNPDLNAERSHRFNLSYNLYSDKWTISIKLGDYFCNNGISSYTILNGDITESTYGNIVSRSVTGANIYVNWNVSGKTRLYMSTDSGYQQFRSDELGRKNNGFSISGIIGAQEVFPCDFRLTSQLYLDSRSYDLQGWSNGQAYFSSSIAKSFLEDKLTLTIRISTNLDKGKMSSITYIEDKNFSSKATTRIPLRFLGLSISYAFGKKQISVKETARSIVNDDLIGGEHK